MNRHLNSVLLAVVLLLLLSACGQAAPTPVKVTEAPATELPGSVPEPTAVTVDSSVPEEFRKYIGSTHPPLSDDLTEDFGMLIENVDGYSLTLVRDGADKMLWLNRLTHYDSSGTAYWEVKDVLPLSNMEAGLTLIPDGCSLNGAPDSRIFVVGREKTIRFAWRVNTTQDTFESIPVDGIECQSDKAMDI